MVHGFKDLGSRTITLRITVLVFYFTTVLRCRIKTAELVDASVVLVVDGGTILESFMQPPIFKANRSTHEKQCSVWKSTNPKTTEIKLITCIFDSLISIGLRQQGTEASGIPSSWASSM